jgi:type I restriction-modification system DNA methylase subunit
MRRDRIKANGVHYTPPALADFLAAVTADVVGEFDGTLTVLDPACGDGALLHAFAKQLPARVRKQVVLHGYETDSEALERARQALSQVGVREVRLTEGDFLSVEGVDSVAGGWRLRAWYL